MATNFWTLLHQEAESVPATLESALICDYLTQRERQSSAVPAPHPALKKTGSLALALGALICHVEA